MRVILLFPGQSSRYPGMLQKLARIRPDVVEPLFRRAEDVLGRPIVLCDVVESAIDSVMTSAHSA